MQLKYCGPSSTRPGWQHANRTPTKVTWFGDIPQCCICSKRLHASLPKPCTPYPTIISFHDATSLWSILSNMLRETSMLPHFIYRFTRALATNKSDRIQSHHYLPTTIGNVSCRLEAPNTCGSKKIHFFKKWLMPICACLHKTLKD